MPTPKQSTVFDKWVNAWANAFEIVNNKTAWECCDLNELVNNIITARKINGFPKSRLKNIILHTESIGKGHRSVSSRDKLVKEAAIEEDLLNLETICIYKINDKNKKKLIGKANIIFQQLYLLELKKYQVKPDLAGWIEFFDRKSKNKKITSFEVKDGANNCGYALVENCRQIDLLRRNPGDIHALGDPNEVIRAAWGAVIAPKEYYENKKNGLNKAIKSSIILSKSTQLRIGFLEWNKDTKELIYLGGSWKI